MKTPPTVNAAVAATDRLLALLARAQVLASQRAVPADAVAEPLLAFVSSLLRMRVRPALAPGWPARDALQVSLFGGTNSGKSTLLNVLVGTPAAGMDVTARFSQHPEAYRVAAVGDHWLSEFPTRFAGYARHLDSHPPRQSDDALARDGYRPAISILDPQRLAPAALASPAATAVFWDVPDFSTEHAAHWLTAILDTVAMADVVVLAVTDESYADERGCVLFRMITAAGFEVHVVANKMPDGGELLADIQHKFNRHWAGRGRGLPAARLHRLPLVSEPTPADRVAALLATEGAAELRRAIAADAERGAELKREILGRVGGFLLARQQELLRPVADEIGVSQRWIDAAHRVTNRQLVARYRAEYLNGASYQEFSAALLRLMELLEVPGIGPVIQRLADIARLPLQLVVGVFRRVTGGAGDASEPLAEEAALGELLQGWFGALRAEAQLLDAEGAHPAWQTITRELDSEAFQGAVVEEFARAYRSYRERVEVEIRERARRIYARLERNPALINTLRGANLLVNAAVTTGAVMSGGLSPTDMVLAPAVSGLWQILVREGMGAFVRSQEADLKAAQSRWMEELMRDPLELSAARLFALDIDEHELASARHDFREVAAALAAAAKGKLR